MSVSDDVSDELGGGTLQLWRVNDLIYRPEADVLAELDKHRWACLADKLHLAIARPACWSENVWLERCM